MSKMFRAVIFKDLFIKIKSRFKSRMVRDEYLKGEAPYGYYVDKYKLYVSDDETPNVVKQIFKEYLKGSGVYSIAKRLTQYGISTPAMYKGKRNAGVNCMSVQCD